MPARLHRETFDNNLEAWQNAGWVGTRANVIKQSRLDEQRALKSSVVAKLADAHACGAVLGRVWRFSPLDRSGSIPDSLVQRRPDADHYDCVGNNHYSLPFT